MKSKILVVGSLNMDLISVAERFPKAGETLIGRDFSTASGGKGANQAVAAARLGADVTLVGKVGRDAFGRELTAAVGGSGVDISRMLYSNTRPTGIADIQVQENKDGTENRILVIPGANADIQPDDVAFLENAVGTYDMVMLQNEIPMEINTLVASYAKKAGVPVMLNPAPAALIPPELLGCLTYLSPNEHEAGILTGICPDSDASRKACVAALRKTGVEKVLITLGKEGCVFSDGENEIRSPAIKAERVVDPTAAGDSFVAAFCVAISAGIPVGKALVFANYVGSVTVSKMGAQTSLPMLDEVFARMKSHNESIADYEALKE